MVAVGHHRHFIDRKGVAVIFRSGVSPLFTRMHPELRRDLARLGRLDHVHWRRISPFLAGSAFQRRFKLPDRRIPRTGSDATNKKSGGKSRWSSAAAPAARYRNKYGRRPFFFNPWSLFGPIQRAESALGNGAPLDNKNNNKPISGMPQSLR
jgi:hypothetical protein